MRVLIVAYSLHLPGGTERSIINLANGLAKENFEVMLISLVSSGGKTAYELNDKIKYSEQDILGKFTSTISRVLALPRVLMSIRKNILSLRPDSVICFGEKMNILIVLSLLFANLRVILSENYPPGIHYINPFWSLLRKLTYRKAEYITVLTPDDINYFSGKIRSKTVFIPNIINKPEYRKAPQTENRKIIAAGRLDTVKRYDLLIKSFSLVNLKHPDWQLEIWGDGKLRDELAEQIKKINLEKQILLKGTTKDIFRELASADFLVLSSEYESFGYVLCEAMSVGIPVISFDCPSGPRHIVRHGTDGLLIPLGDTEKLAEGMIQLIEDRELRIRMGNNALEVLNRFSESAITGRWKNLLHG